MASIKISELEEVTQLSTSDVLPIINENQTKKIPINKLDTRYASAESVANIKTIENGEIFLIELPTLPVGGSSNSNLKVSQLTSKQRESILYALNYCLEHKIKYPILKVTSTADTASGCGSNFFYLKEPLQLSPQHLMSYSNTFWSIGTTQSDNGGMAVCKLKITVLYDESKESYYFNPEGTVVTIWSDSNRVVTVDYSNANFLNKTNTVEYTPTNDYHPSTKKYVDDAIANAEIGGGSGQDLSNYPTKSEVLMKNNEEEYTPTTSYNPATKKYVDDVVANIDIGGGSANLGNTEVYNMVRSELNSEKNLAIFTKIVNDFINSNFTKNAIVIINESGYLNQNDNQGTIICTKVYKQTDAIWGMEGYYQVQYWSSYNYEPQLCFTLITLRCTTNSDGSKTVTSASKSATQTYGLLHKTNTKSYTPTADYHPSTKKYVDDAITTAITSVLESEY